MHASPTTWVVCLNTVATRVLYIGSTQAKKVFRLRYRGTEAGKGREAERAGTRKGREELRPGADTLGGQERADQTGLPT